MRHRKIRAFKVVLHHNFIQDLSQCKQKNQSLLWLTKNHGWSNNEWIKEWTNDFLGKEGENIFCFFTHSLLKMEGHLVKAFYHSALDNDSTLNLIYDEKMTEPPSMVPQQSPEQKKQFINKLMPLSHPTQDFWIPNLLIQTTKWLFPYNT